MFSATGELLKCANFRFPIIFASFFFQLCNTPFILSSCIFAYVVGIYVYGFELWLCLISLEVCMECSIVSSEFFNGFSTLFLIYKPLKCTICSGNTVESCDEEQRDGERVQQWLQSEIKVVWWFPWELMSKRNDDKITANWNQFKVTKKDVQIEKK